MVPSYGLVPLPGGGALLQVHALQDGVFPVLLLDPQHGLLDLPLLGLGGLVRLGLLFFGGVVGEQVQLLRRLLFGNLRLLQQPVGAETQLPDQQIRGHDPVKEGGRRLQQFAGGGGVGKILCACGGLGDLPAVAVRGYGPPVPGGAAGVVQVLPVIAHGEDQLVGHQPLVHQLQGQGVRHLPHHQPGLVKVIGALKHLAGDDALVLRLVCLHVRDGAGFPAPGVVDQDLRVHPEQLVQQFLVVVVRVLSDGAPGNVSHGVEAIGLQLVGVALAHPPEVGEGPVIPKQLPIGHLIQLGDPHPERVGLDLLGHDVHGDLGQVQVRAHARRGGDAGGFQDIQDHGPGQLPGGHVVGVQVIGQVHEHLVNGVGEDVLRRHIFQIDAVDFRAPVNVLCHPGRRYNVVQGQGGILLHIWVMPGGISELMAGGIPQSLGIDRFHPFHHLEQPGPAGNAVGF